MPDLFHRGGLTVTIYRDKEKNSRRLSFSYPPSEPLAQMIVEAWVDENSGAAIGSEKRQRAARSTGLLSARTPS